MTQWGTYPCPYCCPNATTGVGVSRVLPFLLSGLPHHMCAAKLGVMQQQSPLKGKVAVVTGGASGIGKAVCQTLVAHGAAVVVADISPESGHALAKALNENGHNAVFEFCDVTKAEHLTNAIETGTCWVSCCLIFV